MKVPTNNCISYELNKESDMKKNRSIYNTLRATAAMAIALALTLLSGVSAYASLSCDDCHGTNSADIRPIDSAYRNLSTGGFVGSHGEHNVGVVTPTNCAICHGSDVTSYTTSHRTGMINMTRKINNYSASGQGAAKYSKGTSFAQTPTPTLGTCSNVNCHFESATSTWGSTPLGAASLTTCNGCHNARPTTGAHTKHIVEYNNDLTACARCHNNHPGDAIPYQHAVNAGAVLYVSPGHTYNGAANKYFPSQSATRVYGSCATPSCHADPYSTTGSIPSPTWGSAGGCSICHKGVGAFATYSAPNTGSHYSHMALPNALCNKCHAGAVKGSSGGTNHRDGFISVDNDYTGSPIRHAAGSYTGVCNNASCHVSPYDSTNTPITTPVWGSSKGCSSCHNGLGAFSVYSAPNTGSHAKHIVISANVCIQCHPGVIKGVSGGNTHDNGTVQVTGYSISNVAKHPIGTYTGTCSTTSCHMDGNGSYKTTPVWGTALSSNCTGCHGGDYSSVPSSSIISTNKHRAHINNYSSLGRGNNFKCAECHANTVSLSSNTVITNSANHTNGLKNYSGVKAGKMKTVASQTTCGTNYCHSSGQATPVYRNMTGSKLWSGAAKFTCNGCHGNERGATWSTPAGAPNYANHSTLSTSNSHQKHTIGFFNMTDSLGCVHCHNNTVDATVANKMRDYSSMHLNKSRDVEFSYAFNGYSASYHSATKSCTNYCHSNVQAPGKDGGKPTRYSKPSWGVDNGKMNCGSCHNDMSALTESSGLLSPDLLLGTHKRHASSGEGNLACSTCHGSGYSSTTINVDRHADGSIELQFTGKAATTVYSQAGNNVPGDGYGTCSTTKCHGRAVRNWGTNTLDTQCEKCHGSAATAAAGYFNDTAGTANSGWAGTHVSHLAGSHNYSAPITCNQCHVVPATITAFDHMSSLPAKLTFGTLANHSSVVRTISGTGAASAKMTPTYDYVSRNCSNTYCHAGVKNYTSGSYTQQGADATPTWGQYNYLGGSGCGTCHGYPPGGQHTVATNCKACHDHVNPVNTGFDDKTKHINGIVETTADSCLTCHSTACAAGDSSCINKALIGAHDTHTDAALFLAGKTLSGGAYNDPSWIYGIKYKNGFPKFACGFCHPMEAATHKNSTVELDLDPTHALAGTVKTKNAETGPWVTVTSSGSNVTCNNVYCHSNGYISESTKTYAYKLTPNWYAVNPWSAFDKCAQCHGNSPNTGGTVGSSAHGKHLVANHYAGVFSGYSGKMAVSGGANSGAVHGDPNTSTTFNCNTCHYATVQVAYNSLNTVCVACHTNGGTSPNKAMAVYSTANKTHVNGEVDVAFEPTFALKSKAQLRNTLSSVQNLYTSWTRVKGYKTYSSHDLAKHKPKYDLGTCSTTVCHNNTQMEWRTQGPLSCASCHNGLTQ